MCDARSLQAAWNGACAPSGTRNRCTFLNPTGDFAVLISLTGAVALASDLCERWDARDGEIWAAWNRARNTAYTTFPKRRFIFTLNVIRSANVACKRTILLVDDAPMCGIMSGCGIADGRRQTA